MIEIIKNNEYVNESIISSTLKSMKTTRHTETRMQQRSIPQFIIDLLLAFGSSEPAGDGASKFFFDKPARRKVRSYVGPLTRAIEDHMDVYAVIGADSSLITVCHRYERIHRH